MTTRSSVRKSTVHGGREDGGEHHGSRMRNTGPGKWREWRWESYVIPLYIPEDEPQPRNQRPLPEVSLAVVKALTARNSLASLRSAVEELTSDDENPEPVLEATFRAMLHEIVASVLSPEEVQQILPPTTSGDLGATRKSILLEATHSQNLGSMGMHLLREPSGAMSRAQSGQSAALSEASHGR
mmetsp:Transcript_55151/g.131419  ORF Transcript_55151/g.131419 Transcript_55151/m.131419 type:complete len:184 (+) Transcript_55151:86-637(+)